MLPSELTIPQLTILTPTWNRRHMLPRLFESLVVQEAPPSSFEWLVVDDGSTDGTFDWLETLIPDAPFPIRAIRQENGGKHRALNRAAREITSSWFLIVDSDDWLLPGAMVGILDDTTAAKPEVLSIIAPHHIAGRSPRQFILPGRTVNFAEWLDQTKVGDASVVMRTTLLVGHPFPEFEGEKFVAESSSFSRMFRNGGIWLSNNAITQGAYLPDGLSSRALELRTNNPLGAIFTYREHMRSGLSWRLKIRNQLNLYRFFIYATLLNRNPEMHGFRVGRFGRFAGWLVVKIDQLRSA